MSNLRPYSEYQKSSLPWAGAVPEHWDIRRTKYVLQERNQKGFPDEPLLAATQTQGVIRKSDFATRTVVASKDLHLLKLVCVNDFVISLRSFQGGIEYARHRGIISPAYTILRSTNPHHHGYLAWLFKAAPYLSNLTLHVTGIRQGQNIDYSALSRSSLPIPPLDEQAAIVRFLDHVDRKIRRFIQAKRRQIGLLGDLRRAVTSKAILQGFRNAQAQATGNEWFPQIPDGWKIVQLRRLITRAVDGPHHSPEYTSSGIPFISARNIKVDRWELSDAKFISEADYREFSKRVAPGMGDVLYTKGGTTGIARAVDFDYPFQVWVHVAVLKLRRGIIDPHYLSLTLNSTHCYEQSQLFTRGATNQDLGLGRMKGVVLPLPPSLDEQIEIVETVRDQLKPLGAAIQQAKDEISLVREYRTRLISDVVTGKLDVREAARHLPEDLGTIDSEDDSLGSDDEDSPDDDASESLSDATDED